MQTKLQADRRSRRNFLRRMGFSLGAGAAVLDPVLASLVAQARGIDNRVPRFVVVTYSNGNGFEQFCPPELKANINGDDTFIASNFALPFRFQPLSVYQDRMVLIDGLPNRQGNVGHFAHTLMSCVPNATTGDNVMGKMGGITLDQMLAPKLSATSRFPSVHLGVSTGSDGQAGPGEKLTYGLFAQGRERDMPIQLLPWEAYSFVFSDEGAEEEAAARTLERKRLLDHIANDIKLARTRLASPERNKLDEYLAAVEAVEGRLDAGDGECNLQAPGVIDDVRQSHRLFEAQVDLAGAALVCGVSNVLTLSFIGIGPQPQLMTEIGVDPEFSIHDIGHGQGNDREDPSKSSYELIIHWQATQLAKLLDRLDSVTEGDHTILDNSVVLFTSDNAEAHHCRCQRWPVMLLGGGAGRLHTAGRYIRYPSISQTGKAAPPAPEGPAGLRALGDLMSSISHVFDAPVDDFGKDGLEVVKGPLDEILA